MRERGSASIELIVAAPIVALFTMIVLQVSAAFHQAIGNVARASAAAARIVNEYQEANADRGFRRPCLENIEPSMVRDDGVHISIGVGSLRRQFIIGQEVAIATDPICVR